MRKSTCHIMQYYQVIIDQAISNAVNNLLQGTLDVMLRDFSDVREFYVYQLLQFSITVFYYRTEYLISSYCMYALY